MADLATLVYEIDSSSARTAATDLAKMNDAAVKASGGADKLNKTLRDSQGRFISSAESVAKYGDRVKSLAAAFNPALDAVYKYQQREIDLNDAIRLGVVTREQAAQQLAAYAAKLRAATPEAVALERANREAAASAAQTANSYRALMVSIDPAYAAARRYETAIETLNAAQQKGIITDLERARAIKMLDAQMVVATTTAAGGMRNVGSVVNQVGYQIQDVFVSGPMIGWLRAVAQQAPQAAGAFAMLGGSLGAVVPWIGTMIAVGAALAPMFLDAETKARSLDDVIGDMDESFSALSQYLRTATADTADLEKQFGSFAGQIKAFNEYAAGIAVAESIEKSSAVVKLLQTNLDEAANALDRVAQAQAFLATMQSSGMASSQQIADATDALNLYQEELDEITSKLGLSAAQAVALRDGLAAVTRSNDLKLQADQASKMLDYLRKIYASSKDLPEPLRATYKELTNIVEKSRAANIDIGKIEPNLTNSVIAANKLAGSFNSIAGAAARTQVAIDNMTRSLRDAAGMAVYGPDNVPSVPSGLGNFGPNPLTLFTSNAPKTSPRPSARPTLQYDPNWGWDEGGSGGGSGGGGALAQAEKQFQSLRELLEQESMFQVAEYEKRQAQLDNALAKKLVSEQQYQEMRKQLQINYFGLEYEKNALTYTLDLEQLQQSFDAKLLTEEQYLMRRAQLQHEYYSNAISVDQSRSSQILSNMASDFAQMNSLAGGGYDGLLKAQRAFAAGSALINAYLAASQALADPSVSFWGKMAAYAKILAAGMGAVNAIKSGGGGGGAGTSASTATAAAKAEPQRSVLVTLTGDEFLVNMADEIMTKIYDETGNGRVVVQRNYA